MMPPMGLSLTKLWLTLTSTCYSPLTFLIRVFVGTGAMGATTPINCEQGVHAPVHFLTFILPCKVFTSLVSLFIPFCS